MNVRTTEKKTHIQQPTLHEVVQLVVQQFLFVHSGDQMPALYDRMLSDVERTMFDRVLEYTGGNESKAARILGISRTTLRERRRQFRHYDAD